MISYYTTYILTMKALNNIGITFFTDPKQFLFYIRMFTRISHFLLVICLLCLSLILISLQFKVIKSNYWWFITVI